MRRKEQSVWKACVGVVLLFCLIYAYMSYPDYDTTQTRTACLSEKEGARVEILEELEQADHILCRIRANGRMGFAVFREFAGKTLFQQYSTTSSDRLAEQMEIGGQRWLLLICDQPQVRTAVVYYLNQNTYAYTPTDPIDLEGKQMILLPHSYELGSHGYTEYYDEDGNLI